MKHIILVCLIGLILFSANGFCFTIEGDTAIEEANGVRIEVTPHTATSPVKKYRQEFSFENTGIQDLTNVRAVYYFSGKPKITLQKWAVPIYELAEYNEAFDQKYNWSYIESNNTINPYIASVYYADDTNGIVEKILIWQHEVKSFSECTEGQCFYWDEKTLASGNKWQNNGFYEIGETTINNETVWYYYSDQFNITAGETANWEIKYTVPKNTGKWTLGLIQGTPDCLITNTCTQEWI